MRVNPHRRRMLQAIALAAAHPFAALAAPPPPRIARINWPGPDGRLLHGTMAIPASARGRQPAVLIVGDGTNDPLAAYAIERVAAAGLIACAIDIGPGGAMLDDALASLRWLGSNRYATGKVAAIGFGAGATLVGELAIAAGASLAAAVLFGGGAPQVPTAASITAAMLFVPGADPEPARSIERWSAMLADAGRSVSMIADAHRDPQLWRASFDRATAFLREHLT